MCTVELQTLSKVPLALSGWCRTEELGTRSPSRAGTRPGPAGPGVPRTGSPGGRAEGTRWKMTSGGKLEDGERNLDQSVSDSERFFKNYKMLQIA